MAAVDECATPRVSGSLARWPLFREMAVVVSEMANRRALRLEKPSHEVDISKARRLRAIAKDASGLADAFEAWEHGDPGTELRTAAVTHLLDLRAEAADLGADVNAALERHG